MGLFSKKKPDARKNPDTAKTQDSTSKPNLGKIDINGSLKRSVFTIEELTVMNAATHLARMIQGFEAQAIKAQNDFMGLNANQNNDEITISTLFVLLTVVDVYTKVVISAKDDDILGKLSIDGGKTSLSTINVKKVCDEMKVKYADIINMAK